jgi:N-acetylglucosamine-6-phosphate deacetylase
MKLGVQAAVVDGVLLRGDVEVRDGRIAAVGLDGGNGSGVAIPGLVDLQVNGFAGVDLAAADEAGYRRAGEGLLESGVTAFQPTFITAPEEELTAALAAVPAGPIGPRVIGVHLEGPFLSPLRLGAHPVVSRRDPDPALLRRLLAAGPVSEMTLAPELEGALELIDVLNEHGVVASCGHSDAPAEQADRAFERGAATVTHLFNAMRPLGHRDPGIAGAALARDDVVVQLILDGQHLADETAKVVWRAAAGRVALVSDAIAAAGIGDGSYRLGAVDVEVRAGVARREDGVLAGSSRSLIDAVRSLHALGVPLADAVHAATAVPARVIRRPDLGSLRVGAEGDIVVLNDSLEIRAVFVGGEDLVAA